MPEFVKFFLHRVGGGPVEPFDVLEDARRAGRPGDRLEKVRDPERSGIPEWETMNEEGHWIMEPLWPIPDDPRELGPP